MSDLQVFPISLPGGIEQSKPSPEPTDLEELENFGIFRNRIGRRAPLSTVATLQDDTGTPALGAAPRSGASDVTHIVDIAEHLGKIYTLSYSSTEDKIYLHSMQVDGTVLTLEAVVYTGISSKPLLKMVSFEGGTATSGTARLYIFDYNQNVDTVYWDGSSITTLTADLDADSSDENVRFSLMIPFKFHLWGTGFFDGGTGVEYRPEMLRFSQPGLFPGTDPAGGSASKEWFTADHRSVGRRGDKIVALSKAGDRLLIFQKRAVHAIYGSGANTWTRQELSDIIGCVGPNAVATVDERVCYFWASDGPYRTDGSQIQYIGQPIRQLAVEVDAAEDDTRVGYSPDDGLVYFIVSSGGADAYNLALVFDHRRERWMKSQWFTGASTAAEFGALQFMDSTSAPGPAAAPSLLTATATTDTTIDLAWTNGDTNINTVTKIYRSTSTGFTPNDATNKITEVGSGQATYTDTGLTQDTEYFYKTIHERNSQDSSASNEDSDTTWLAEPTGVGLGGLSDGLRISGTNNASGNNIVVQRSLDGSTGWTAVSFSPISTPGASFSGDDTGLSCGTTYYYRAKATKSGSTDSEWSTVVNREACAASEPPDAPTSPSVAVISTSELTLSWTDNSFNEDEFQVERYHGSESWANIANPAVNSTSYADTGLTSNTQYFYRVRASNSAGQSSWAEANGTTSPDLDAPTDLSAEVLSSSSVSLTWTDNAADETGYQIHYSTTGGAAFVAQEEIAANSTSTTVTGLSGSETYYFKVRAVTATVNGTASGEVTAETHGHPPSAPSSLTATKDSGSPESEIDLAWTDNSSDETGFEIQRKSGSGSFATITTTSANITTYADTGLTSGTTYTYRVRATGSSADSDWSNEASDTTDGAGPVPDAPTSLSAVEDGADLLGVEASAVDLSWTDNADNEDNYEIQRCTGASCASFAALATLSANTTSYKDTTVTDNATSVTIYRYRVRATNATGNSAWLTSGDVEVEPQCTPSSVSAADTSYCADDVANPRIRVSWSDGDTDGLVERRIYRAVNGGSFTLLTDNPTQTSYHDDEAISFGSSYEYKVAYYFGTTGENTGEFMSTQTSSVSPVDPDCGELA